VKIIYDMEATPLDDSKAAIMTLESMKTRSFLRIELSVCFGARSLQYRFDHLPCPVIRLIIYGPRKTADLSSLSSASIDNILFFIAVVVMRT